MPETPRVAEQPDQDQVEEYDAIVISTAHSLFKNAALYRDAKIVIDTRNIVPKSALESGRLYKA